MGKARRVRRLPTFNDYSYKNKHALYWKRNIYSLLHHARLPKKGIRERKKQRDLTLAACFGGDDDKGVTWRDKNSKFSLHNDCLLKQKLAVEARGDPPFTREKSLLLLLLLHHLLNIKATTGHVLASSVQHVLDGFFPVFQFSSIMIQKQTLTERESRGGSFGLCSFSVCFA